MVIFDFVVSTVKLRKKRRMSYVVNCSSLTVNTTKET